METLQKVLEVLEVLAEEARPLWEEEARQGSGLPRSRAEALALVAREASPETTGRVTEACVHYARALRWPKLSRDEAALCAARLAQGVRFGHWLQTAIPQLPARPAEAWIDTLLIGHWSAGGRCAWQRELLRPFDQEA